MSSASTHQKSIGRWLSEVVALAAVLALLFVVTRLVPSYHGEANTMGAVGLLLLCGTLMSEVLSLFKLPHLTGYIAAGVLIGPYALNLVDDETVELLSPVNTLALALIAFAGGAELKLELLKSALRSLLVALSLQTLVVFVGMSIVFYACRPLLPFMADYGTAAAIGVALLWAVIAVSRSPAATLGVLAQTRAKGPLTSFSVAYIMASDVVVVVLLASVLAFARTLLDPSAELSTHALTELGHELLGTVSVGTTLGLILAMYLRFVGKQLLVVLVALGFGATEVIHYLGFEPLLAFLVAGAVVQNLSKQGDVFLHAIEETSGVVYVVFFASAGAHLKLPLVAQMWHIALILAGARALLSYATARLSSHLAKDDPAVAKWGWSSMISQAGLTLGIVGVIGREFPDLGASMGALAIATVAINEIVGPIVFKLALDRAGESRDASSALDVDEPLSENAAPPA